MTNFEHWKQELTAEEFVKIIKCNERCPALEQCNITSFSCRDNYLSWGNEKYIERECRSCKWRDTSSKDEPCRSCNRLYTRDCTDKWEDRNA